MEKHKPTFVSPLFLDNMPVWFYSVTVYNLTLFIWIVPSILCSILAKLVKATKFLLPPLVFIWFLTDTLADKMAGVQLLV